MVNRRSIRRKSALFIFVTILLAATATGYCYLATMPSHSAQPPVHTVSVAQLEKVLQIAEFSTMENTYNAVATQTDSGNNPVYHVAYKGKIVAGIDFSSIQISCPDGSKQITITLPEPQILDFSVDMGSLEYIFLDSKYKTEHVAIDAYQLCIENLQERIMQEDVLLTMARESAIDTIRALFEPWLRQLDNSYILVVA